MLWACEEHGKARHLPSAQQHDMQQPFSSRRGATRVLGIMRPVTWQVNVATASQGKNSMYDVERVAAHVTLAPFDVAHGGILRLHGLGREAHQPGPR